MKTSQKIRVFLLILCSLIRISEAINPSGELSKPESEKQKDFNDMDLILDSEIPTPKSQPERKLLDFRTGFGEGGFPFNVFKNIEHELEEANTNPKSAMQVVEFNSAMKSEQSSNDPKPKVVGFSSGLKLNKSPNGRVTVRKFEKPFGTEIPSNKDLDFNRVLIDGPLRIEPIITPGLLKNEPVIGRKSEGFESFLNNIMNHGPDQPRNGLLFGNNQIFQNPAGLAGVLKINIDTPNDKEEDTSNFFKSIFGQRKSIPIIEPHPKLVVLRPLGEPQSRIEFPKPVQAIGLPNPTSLLEGLFGNSFHHQSKLPANDIDEIDMNPFAMLFGPGTKKIKKITHKRRTVIRKIQKTHKKAKSNQLNTFLNKILEKRKIGGSQKVLVSHPKVTSLGLHTGVAKLLNLIESSEKDRLTQPVNEPKRDNPFAAIFGEGDESAGVQNYLLSGILGENQAISHHIDPLPHPEVQKCDSEVPVLKRVFNHLPHSYNLDHIPLMNNFYHMRNIKDRLAPIKYPSLGHRKNTLEKIRNNIIVPAGPLSNHKFHRKGGKMHLIKPTETYLVSQMHNAKRNHYQARNQFTEIKNPGINNILKFKPANQNQFSNLARFYRRSSHKKLHYKRRHRLNHFIQKPVITNIAISTQMAKKRRLKNKRHRKARKATTLKRRLERFIDRLVQENNDPNGRFII